MKNLETRIEELESKIAYKKGPIPGLVYISGLHHSKTHEEAKAEYKQKHGFELPEDAPVIKIVAYDGRKPKSHDK